MSQLIRPSIQLPITQPLALILHCHRLRPLLRLLRKQLMHTSLPLSRPASPPPDSALFPSRYGCNSAAPRTTAPGRAHCCTAAPKPVMPVRDPSIPPAAYALAAHWPLFPLLLHLSESAVC